MYRLSYPSSIYISKVQRKIYLTVSFELRVVIKVERYEKMTVNLHIFSEPCIVIHMYT